MKSELLHQLTEEKENLRMLFIKLKKVYLDINPIATSHIINRELKGKTYKLNEDIFKAKRRIYDLEQEIN